jgi:Carboxypeptidase regulatory-like domain
MKKRLWVRMLSALFVAIATMRAQEFKGTLLGRITDPSGAVIPNANITVRNEETGVPEHTISNAGGNYTFPFLLPGRYTVRTEAKGFRTTEQHAVNVDINDRIELNVMLQVGSSSEKIVVEAEFRSYRQQALTLVRLLNVR